MTTNKRVDLRYTYICAHCGGFAELSFWEIEVFDCGTTLTCDKCGEQTVILLIKPDAYTDLVAYKAARRLTPAAPDAEPAAQNGDPAKEGDLQARRR